MPPRRRLCPFGLDPRQQSRGRFVVWILGDELASKSFFQNRLAQHFGAGEGTFKLCVQFFSSVKAGIENLDDLGLFGECATWNRKSFQKGLTYNSAKPSLQATKVL